MVFDKAIGIKEIARKAGVSSTTVSRVLREKGEIAEETRERVKRIALELGYRPNLAVRTMQTGQSNIIGILMDITGDPGFRGQVLNGIHDILIAADYLPVLIWARRDDPDPRFDEANQVHRLVDHRVDGIIMSTRNITGNFVQYIDDLSIPVVIIDEWLENVRRDIVITDNELGGSQAARHLLDLGHRKLAYLCDRGTEEEEDGGRAHGFLKEVDSVSGASCETIVASDANGGYQEAFDLLSREDRPTAIFAFNDYVAFHACRAAAALGIDIPNRISILGFGNVSNVIELCPDLTTFEQQPRRIGSIAAERILGRIIEIDLSPPEIVKIEPEIVLRGTTARCHHHCDGIPSHAS